MSSLYKALLSNMGKTASQEDVRQGLDGLDTEELVRLAEELADLTKDPELMEMAKILPVYSSGSGVEDTINVEQTIGNVKPGEIPVGDDNKEDIALMAADGSEEQEKFAAKEDDEKEVSAAEVLYSILKEGASVEKAIEVRAGEMVEDWVKLAEDYEVARAVADQAAGALTGNPMKAYEYSEQIMDKAKTVAATNDIPMSEAAEAVAVKVIETAKTAGLLDEEYLAKQAAKIENELGTIKWPDKLNTHAFTPEVNAALAETRAFNRNVKALAALGLLGTAGAGYGVYNAVSDSGEKEAYEYLEGLNKQAAKIENELGTIKWPDKLNTHAFTPEVNAALAETRAFNRNVKALAALGLLGTAGAGYGVYNAVSDSGEKVASVEDAFETLSSYAYEIENAYEKVAEEIGDLAESMLYQAGQAQGLVDPKLYEFVRKGMEEIKTLAAKRDINLAEAAKAYLSGDTGSVAGVVEPISPPPSVAPSPAKAPINSNQTQDPDKYIPEMVAPADPSVLAEKTAMKASLKALIKEAMADIANE